MNKLLATLIDFHSFQSYSLPTGNIDQLKQPQSRLCRMSTKRKTRALSHFSAFSTSAPRLTRSTIASYYPTRSTCARLRSQGSDHSLDRVISHGTQSICAVQRGHQKDCTSHLRGAARIRLGADPFPFLLGRSRRHRSASGLQSARVCRRLTNIWIDGSERCG